MAGTGGRRTGGGKRSRANAEEEIVADAPAAAVAEGTAAQQPKDTEETDKLKAQIAALEKKMKKKKKQCTEALKYSAELVKQPGEEEKVTAAVTHVTFSRGKFIQDKAEEEELADMTYTITHTDEQEEQNGEGHRAKWVKTWSPTIKNIITRCRNSGQQKVSA